LTREPQLPRRRRNAFSIPCRISPEARLAPAGLSPPASWQYGGDASFHRDKWVPLDRIKRPSAPRLKALSNSVHAGYSAPQHLGREQARLQSPPNPAPRGGPESLPASPAAKALVAAAGRPGRKRVPTPRTPGRHRMGSISRTPGPPPRSINLMPASSSARRSAARMARRGSVAPRSNWRRVTTPTSAAWAR
jgi:hypothetical protein